ncbi:MAG: hypothetical protein HY286_03765 [Planctomycetes bacterium]|nr:hypothetical protein [Planctomycetota bacterium]
MNLLLTPLFFLGVFQGGNATPKHSDAIAEKVEKYLSSAVDEDATKRRAAAERLVALGTEAVSAIADGLTRGNHNSARTAAIALGEIADDGAGKALLKYFSQKRGPGTDVDLAVVGIFAMGGCSSEGIPEWLMTIVEDGRESDQVRATAALALARRSDRKHPRLAALFQKYMKHPDADPEIFAGLVLAISRNDPDLAAGKIPGLLKDATDPVVRAACWLALSNLKKPAPPGAAAADLKSNDLAIARCAILGVAEAPRKGDNSPEEMREMRIVALGLGAGDLALGSLASSESSAELRKIWLGALAERGWTAMLVASPWKETEIGENGRFAAAALLALKGGFSSEEKSKLSEQAKARWKADPATATGAALLLAAMKDKDAEPLLAPPVADGGKRPAAVRLAWKHLRDELDQRRFEQAVYAYALSQKTLPQGWISDAESRFAAAILGHGSPFFVKQTKMNVPLKALLPEGLPRRKRVLPNEHQMYADLWGQLVSSPFDAMLQFPADESG